MVYTCGVVFFFANPHHQDQLLAAVAAARRKREEADWHLGWSWVDDDLCVYMGIIG